MRKFLLLILLASAASPALAEPDSDGTPDRARNRAERAQSDSDAPRSGAPCVRSARSAFPSRAIVEPRANVGRSERRTGRDSACRACRASVGQWRGPRLAAGFRCLE